MPHTAAYPASSYCGPCASSLLGSTTSPDARHTIAVLAVLLTPLRALHAETLSNLQQGNRLV